MAIDRKNFKGPWTDEHQYLACGYARQGSSSREIRICCITQWVYCGSCRLNAVHHGRKFKCLYGPGYLRELINPHGHPPVRDASYDNTYEAVTIMLEEGLHL